MASRVRARRVSQEVRRRSVVTSSRYKIAIGGVYVRTISADCAETTFWRWSRRVDMITGGDLTTGFFWEWPDPPGTRLTITPEHHDAPAATQMLGGHDVEAASRRPSMPQPAEAIA